MEPTSGAVEAGCQGTLRVRVTVPGRRAHSARSWLGENAIHGAAPLLTRLVAYDAREVDIDGCLYREGLNAVRIEGGVAGNVVPDECTVLGELPLRPGPLGAGRRTTTSARCWGSASSSTARRARCPGWDRLRRSHFVQAVGTEPTAKLGWTDVARFAALGIPALNFGPGDPNLAHTREESVEVERIVDAERALRAYLTG